MVRTLAIGDPKCHLSCALKTDAFIFTIEKYSRVTNCSHLRAPKTINSALQTFDASETIAKKIGSLLHVNTKRFHLLRWKDKQLLPQNYSMANATFFSKSRRSKFVHNLLGTILWNVVFSAQRLIIEAEHFFVW